MTHFTFSIHQPEIIDSTAQFSIKVSNEQASFILKNNFDRIEIYGPELCLGHFSYYDTPNRFQSAECHVATKMNEELFDEILNDEILTMCGVGGKLCDIDWHVDKNTITFAGVTVPAHKSTRESLVEVFKHYNKQFDILDHARDTGALQYYVSKRYHEGYPTTTETSKKMVSKNGKTINEYFKSGKGSEEFRAEYVKMLLEHGTI
jgi:hypothetical protein